MNSELFEFDEFRLSNLTEDDWSDACQLYNGFAGRVGGVGIDSPIFRSDLCVADFDVRDRLDMVELLREYFTFGDLRKPYLVSNFKEIEIGRMANKFAAIDFMFGLTKDLERFKTDVLGKSYLFYSEKKRSRLTNALFDYLKSVGVETYRDGIDVFDLFEAGCLSYVDRIEQVLLKDVVDWSDRDAVLVRHCLVYAVMSLDKQIETHFRDMFYRHPDPFASALSEVETLLVELKELYRSHNNFHYSDGRWLRKSITEDLMSKLAKWDTKMRRLLIERLDEGIVMDRNLRSSISHSVYSLPR